MLLVVDNGSIYTQNLIDFLEKKTKLEVITFDNVNLLNLTKYDSFILSGRRKNNQLMNSTNSKIVKHAIQQKKPLLGICYGAEILNLTLGGTIKKSNSLQKGNEVITTLKKNPLCENKIDVFESHNYEISRLGNSLACIANSNSCKNEIINIKNSNIFGTQFHPEMTNDGKILIEKFCFLTN
ncbi:MAG TPA: gamma-glutamyl-gamma-aminobutyrate hydrolase family protein [Nitrosopumilaceae archaeon]|nr:gamma-glutamyl-gamma-aminobutyrate hydrolase family protein [Nitrosopumilaceae archaeon]